jgi:integrase
MQLPNNCKIGKIGVTPKNWHTPQANIKKDWRIFYEFYPDCNLKESQQVVIRGMNKYKTLSQRQESVRILIADEEKRLQNGFNPVTKETVSGQMAENISLMTLRQSLEYAFNKINATPEHKINTKSAKKYFLQSAELLNYHNIPIKEITRRHLKIILEGIGKLKVQTKEGWVSKKWNNALYNDYRTLIASLFKILHDEDIVSHNTMLDVPKLKKIRNPRRVITIEEKEIIKNNKHLLTYEFWRYIIILKLSGARIIELLRVKKEHVDLQNREFKVLVKKGSGDQRWEPRAITKVSFPFWEELYNQAQRYQYLFGEDLLPQTREKPIRREQITRRWNRHMKKKLGIGADVYSLKHFYLDEVAKELGIKEAQIAAGHSTPVITMNHYAINEKQRQLDRLKEVDIDF